MLIILNWLVHHVYMYGNSRLSSIMMYNYYVSNKNKKGKKEKHCLWRKLKLTAGNAETSMCVHTLARAHTSTHTKQYKSTCTEPLSGLVIWEKWSGRDRQTAEEAQLGPREEVPHLVHVDVVEVVFVVNGLEHTLQLPGGAAMDHQHEGDSDRVCWHVLHWVLIPLDILVGFAWGKDSSDESETWMSFGGARNFPGAFSGNPSGAHSSHIRSWNLSNQAGDEGYREIQVWTTEKAAVNSELGNSKIHVPFVSVYNPVFLLLLIASNMIICSLALNWLKLW